MRSWKTCSTGTRRSSWAGCDSRKPRDYGILRLLTADPEKVAAALLEKGFIFSVTPINAIPVSDEPGGLNDLLARISKAGIDVQYIHVQPEGYIPYMMVRVADPAALDGLPEQ